MFKVVGIIVVFPLQSIWRSIALSIISFRLLGNICFEVTSKTGDTNVAKKIMKWDIMTTFCSLFTYLRTVYDCLVGDLDHYLKASSPHTSFIMSLCCSTAVQLNPVSLPWGSSLVLVSDIVLYTVEAKSISPPCEIRLKPLIFPWKWPLTTSVNSLFVFKYQRQIVS